MKNVFRFWFREIWIGEINDFLIKFFYNKIELF